MLDPEDIEQIARRIVQLLREQEALDQRRANSALRSKRYRERHASSQGTVTLRHATVTLNHAHPQESVTAPSQNGCSPSLPFFSLSDSPSLSPSSSPLPTKKLITRTRGQKPEDWQEFLAYAIKKGCSKDEATYFYTTWKANGWTTSGKAIKDWRAKVVSWHTAGYYTQTQNNHRK